MRHNLGYVTLNQFYQVLSQLGTPLTGEEIQAIEQKYSNFKGFHYIAFLKKIEPQIVIRPKYEDFVQRKILVNRRTLHEPPKDEHDIVEILANVKSQVVKKRTNILQFMSGFDPINHQVITCSEFKRSLRNADIILTDNEMNVLCVMFKAPLRDGYVDYIRFCDLIEEVFTQKRLLHNPLIVPLQHLPSNDGVDNNLTNDERAVVSEVLKKLSRYHDTFSNMSELFQNYDKTQCGAVTKEQLTKILILRDIRMLSQHEIEILHKCFNKKNRFLYRDFLKALKLVANAQIQLPF
ncbi:uncharacterized protein LOC134826891 [Culicoides brevitarsis]|uniref:uncharacterized protein LOC134826891 n=1 Tax=Culicoides brevitarsis TaxID=469753 RepID=UPI00307B9AFE